MAKTTHDFRSETFEVNVSSMACRKCGWLTMTDEQADELRLKVADAYREKHARLTSADIRQARERLGLSQQAFSLRGGFGIASLKRWETGSVQSKSSDALIRLKVNEMTEAGVSATSLGDWFTNCSQNVVTLLAVDLQSSRTQEPAKPSWRSPSKSRNKLRSVRKTAKYDPDLAIAA